MDYRREFLRLFSNIAPYHHRQKVFSDSIFMMAVSISNRFDYCQKMEDEYLSLIKGYEKDDLNMIAKLYAVLVSALENCPSDFLGEVFMETNTWSANLSQFFTPFSLSLTSAELTLGEVNSVIEQKGYFTLTEPACGSGGMIIAASEVVRKKGFNPQDSMWFSCVDVDRTAAYMAFLQLSLLGIPGCVSVGNSLTMNFSKHLYTPMHFVGGWGSKLKRRSVFEMKLIGEISSTVTDSQHNACDYQMAFDL
jgi:type I restriction-modification system DNA methylase subunit